MTERLFVGLDKTKKKVHVPIFHMAVTGQTQLSGKTTITKTLARQAVEKYGYKVLVFDTKENIEDFQDFGKEIPVCMRETTDSLILIGLAEAIFGRRLTQYYSALSWITEDAKTLKDVIDRAKKKEETSRGWFKGACRTLWDLLDRLQKQLAKTETVGELELPYKINRMVLNYFPRQSQQLFVKYALEDALRKYGKKLIVIIDEAFKFIPQRYSSACKKPIQDVITQGAGTKLFIWITTQFLAPTDKDPLKACAVRLLGTQDHDTEATHTIDLIPRAKQRGFDKDTIMTLPLGHFVTITKKFAELTYAVPNGVPLEVAEKVVVGELTSEYVRDNVLKKKEGDDEMYRAMYEKEREKVRKLELARDHFKEERDKQTGITKQVEQKFQKEVKKLKSQLVDVTRGLNEATIELERLRKFEAFDKALTDLIETKIPTATKVSPEAIQKEIRKAVQEILPKTVDLEHIEQVVNLTHTEKTVKMDTTTQQGQIMYVAINDLSPEGFTEKQMSEALKERGWNIPHTSLAPLSSNLVKNGLLIRIPNTRPKRYRLPSKLKVKVAEK